MTAPDGVTSDRATIYARAIARIQGRVSNIAPSAFGNGNELVVVAMKVEVDRLIAEEFQRAYDEDAPLLSSDSESTAKRQHGEASGRGSSELDRKVVGQASEQVALGLRGLVGVRDHHYLIDEIAGDVPDRLFSEPIDVLEELTGEAQVCGNPQAHLVRQVETNNRRFDFSERLVDPLDRHSGRPVCVEEVGGREEGGPLAGAEPNLRHRVVPEVLGQQNGVQEERDQDAIVLDVATLSDRDQAAVDLLNESYCVAARGPVLRRGWLVPLASERFVGLGPVGAGLPTCDQVVEFTRRVRHALTVMTQRLTRGLFGGIAIEWDLAGDPR